MCEQLKLCWREKRGRKRNFFLAPNAGALRVLDAAICSVVKGFWVLSLPGNVSFLDFLFWSPVSLRHLFIPLPGQRLKKEMMRRCCWGTGFVLRNRIYPDTKDSEAFVAQIWSSSQSQKWETIFYVVWYSPSRQLWNIRIFLKVSKWRKTVSCSFLH